MVSGSGICTKRVVVDASHHMLGRLSSITAKFKPSHGLIHFRAPAKIFGGPSVVLFHTRPSVGLLLSEFEDFKPGHKYCLLGRLSSEEKRKAGSHAAYERKKQLNKLRLKIEKTGKGQLGAQLENLVTVKY
ncbi:hypothetical protein MKW98_025922 [Papaver atlanticum]|uniref:Uncharacterized protein n=1 Tax=Papaver atlanticum TaxID=357466 RepID=A0AAD4SJZ0_9MAGN|nr:hypothetical protein MKW98_025922 [Papaver atlanticum]